MTIDILDVSPTESPRLARHLAILEVLWGALAVRVTPHGEYFVQREPDGLFAGPTGALHVCFPTDPDHTPAAVWEALVTRGLFPETWLSNPQRLFLRPARFRAYPQPKPSAETLRRLKEPSFFDISYVRAPYIPLQVRTIGSAPADEGLGEPVRVDVEVLTRAPNLNGDYYGTIDLMNEALYEGAVFPDFAQVLTLSYHPVELLEEVEALAWEIAARLAPFGLKPPTRIIWEFEGGDRPPEASPLPLWAVLGPHYGRALRPYVVPGDRGVEWGRVLQPGPLEVVAATWDLYFDSPNPFEPFFALAGYREAFTLKGFSADGTIMLCVRPVPLQPKGTSTPSPVSGGIL